MVDTVYNQLDFLIFLFFTKSHLFVGKNQKINKENIIILINYNHLFQIGNRS
jgi:hypothetical protein